MMVKDIGPGAGCCESEGADSVLKELPLYALVYQLLYLWLNTLKDTLNSRALVKWRMINGKSLGNDKLAFYLLGKLDRVLCAFASH